MGADKISLHKKAFLAAFRKNGNVTRAAEAAKIDRRTHYDWMKADAAYILDFADAQKDASDFLEEEARRRATEGVRKYRFNPKTGEPYTNPETGEPYYEHDYSDTLLIFLMKGADPEKYAERHKVGSDPDQPVILKVVYDDE